ncbi:MAG: hypothetical protein HY360_12610 [Verrucomicrobia bacterium]|nr:hypothetical protein [Verrucomicrobiota bacterium]
MRKKTAPISHAKGLEAIAAPMPRADWLITILESSRLDAATLLADKRAYWRIENGLLNST